MATILSKIAPKKSATLFVFLVGGSMYFGVLDFVMNQVLEISLWRKFFENSSVFQKKLRNTVVSNNCELKI